MEARRRFVDEHTTWRRRRRLPSRCIWHPGGYSCLVRDSGRPRRPVRAPYAERIGGRFSASTPGRVRPVAVRETALVALGATQLAGIEWGWLSCNGAIGKAPLGGDKTGPNPTDRAKKGRNARCSATGMASRSGSRSPARKNTSCSPRRIPRPPLGDRSTHSWLNRYRGLLTRWSKNPENHRARLQLACGRITRRLTTTTTLPR